ncbi:hypothetical protein LUZ60_001221 [Juncus effusus]|nr:hypothetical protein LUZ60_001221 [Juncus effusus]
MANPFYGGGTYRSREGLTARSGAGSEERHEIQLRIDPVHGDLDQEIDGLHTRIRQLKGVAQEIESEAKSQNDFLSQLHMSVMRAQAEVKNNMRRMNRSIIRQGSNHLVHVVLFALVCFFLVYLLIKFRR